MTTRSMDVFSLRDTVVSEYQSFARSFTTIAAPDIRRQVEAIYAEDRYWPEPLIQINPSYKRGRDVASLADDGLLDRGCKDIFRSPPPAEQPDGASLSLYLHQERAIATAAARESFVVTTGTGSGKSLCFFIPIVSAVLAEKRKSAAKRTRAIVIYPMNALANSQIKELERYLPERAGGRPVTFGRYTGQDEHAERRAIADDPPDVLLTNFMMLELLMTRQDELDRKVIGNCAGLSFLVLDELHTYRGRQGADVALLVRRVRERLAPDDLLCIGTSATMKSEGTVQDRNRVVADVASKLFSVEVPPSNVIGETLERVTDRARDHVSVRPTLGAAFDQPIPANITDAALHHHPLAIWVETRLGVTFSEPDQRWIRSPPLTLSEATAELARDAGRPPAACEQALRQLLLISGKPERERTGDPEAGGPDPSGRSFFPFRLHQFISGAGYAYATLEPPGRRSVTVEGQQFLPGTTDDRRLYPTHSCRECGQEYHPVRIASGEGRRIALARSIDDAPVTAKDEKPAEQPPEADDYGFLTMQPQDVGFTFADDHEDYPESWRETDAAGGARLKPDYRKLRARREHVEPSGALGKGAPAWYLPGCAQGGER